MRMLSMLPVCATLFAVVVLLPERAEACSCVPPPAPKVAMKSATAVFEGKVVAVEEDPTAHRRTGKFEVLRVWKGEVPANARVATGDNSAMCGFNLEVGQTYLVYADGEAGALSTGLCSRSANSKDVKEDFKALGASKPAGSAVPEPEPVKPAEPAKPAEPEKPPEAKPPEPAKPAEPVKPAAEPAKPAEPAKQSGCAVASEPASWALLIGLLALRRRRRA